MYTYKIVHHAQTIFDNIKHFKIKPRYIMGCCGGKGKGKMSHYTKNVERKYREKFVLAQVKTARTGGFRFQGKSTGLSYRYNGTPVPMHPLDVEVEPHKFTIVESVSPQGDLGDISISTENAVSNLADIARVKEKLLKGLVTPEAESPIVDETPLTPSPPIETEQPSSPKEESADTTPKKEFSLKSLEGFGISRDAFAQMEELGYNDREKLAEANLEQLTSIDGIGNARASTILNFVKEWD